MNQINTMKLAMKALEPFITPNWAGSGVDEANAAYTALRSALSEQPAHQEPPAWWPAVENILKEYGLQAIDFVADFKAALAEQPAPVQQEPVAWIRWEWNRSGLRTLVFSKPTELPLAEEATGVVYDPLYTSPQPAQQEQEPVAALQRVMTRLADLLDEDQFAEIEGIVTNAGVMPPAQRKPWIGLTQEDRLHFLNEIIGYGTGFVAPIDAVICSIEAKLKEKNNG